MRATTSQPRTPFFLLPTWLRTGPLLSLFFLIALSGCASTGSSQSSSSDEPSIEQLWVQSIINYKNEIPPDHPDQIDAVFQVSDEMRLEVREQFGGLSKHGAAKAIAYWLLDENGRNMEYDVSANFTPTEAYEMRRGNCLSFTMLLQTLAQELDIEVEYNSVSIPDTWDLNEDLGMVFYRHVNGVVEALGQRQIFDLAMDLYDPGYPQKFVSKNEIMAMWSNNRAISWLEKQDFQQAVHAIKLGVSYDPFNPDLWVNLGVIHKRQGNFKKAEIAFLHAYDINKYSVVAVSNLERLYRQQGMSSKAAGFAKQAERARLSNPYVHYHRALELYEDKKYKKATRAANRAIILHDKDPRFFELKSLIAQQRGDYKKALKALEKAYLASTGSRQRDKYLSKVELVSQNAIEAFEQQQRRERGVRIRNEVELRQPNYVLP